MSRSITRPHGLRPLTKVTEIVTSFPPRSAILLCFLSLAFDVMKQTQGGHGISLSGPQTSRVFFFTFRPEELILV